MTYCPLDLVENYLRRFVAYPSEHARVAHTLWIAHTHLIECFDTTPRLAFMSAEKESGKTRALEVTALFVPNPRLSFSMSTAALVRIISKGHEEGLIPTILFDEIDNVFCKSEEGIGELRGALNSGYRRGAKSTRCTAHGANVVDFDCFAPLAVAGLKELPDTLASRAVFVHMRRRAPDEPVESFRLRYHPAEAQPIAEALGEWCARHKSDINGYEPKLPDGIADRMADCWEPLLTIAEIAGDDWPARAHRAAIYLTSCALDDTLTSGVELLSHIRDAFLEADKIHTDTLLRRLIDREESPWADIRGKPLADRGLAERLRSYRIKSRDVKISGLNRKGYFKADFEQSWKSYLTPSPVSATSATSATNLGNKDNLVALVATVAPNRGESGEDGDSFTPLKDPSLPLIAAEQRQRFERVAAQFDALLDPGMAAPKQRRSL